MHDIVGQQYFRVIRQFRLAKTWDSHIFFAVKIDILLWQMLGECSEDLRSRGFQVRNRPLDCECTLRTDMNYLKRVIDNLESNIIKYADPAEPVQIGAHAAKSPGAMATALSVPKPPMLMPMT